MRAEQTDIRSVIILRALGALLDYPGPALRQGLPEIEEIVSVSSLLDATAREGVLRLIALTRGSDALQAEERYVELFDRGRATSLNLFEHVHGDDRDRGAAMVDLKQIYEQAGLNLSTRELPDYLPVVLEYLSCRDLVEARAMLGECAHILRKIGEMLMRRRSAYSAVFAALLAIADKPGLDPKIGRRQMVRDDNSAREQLDREWAEHPAFAPPVETVSSARAHRAGPCSRECLS